MKRIGRLARAATAGARCEFCRRHPRGAVIALLVAAGCATQSTGARPVTAAAASAGSIPTSLRWSRSSAEHRAIYLEVYRAAGDALAQRSAGHQTGSWAVILDADETVLDNSLYEQERTLAHQPFSAPSWDAWVKRAAATALPGAAEFTHRVQALGGVVVIVTNRDDSACDITRENLRRAEIAFDEALCKPAGAGDDKNPRFDAVAGGTSPSVLPPLDVVMWLGDNVQDFPHATQALRLTPVGDASLARFGVSWFALPNPMYGSWEHNPLP